MASTGSNSTVPEAEAAASATVPPAADAVVALVTYNSERTIHEVASAIRDELAGRFGSISTRVVLADAGSADGTIETARAVLDPLSFVTIDAGAPGSGKRVPPLRRALQAAIDLKAKSIAVFDAGVAAPETGRLARLLDPVVGGEFDYALPYYPRHRYDGALTKAIVYPIFRALYGAALRQPAGSEFSCSGPLAEHLLAQDFWEDEQSEAGINIWLAAAAVSHGARVCETALCTRPVPPQDQLFDLSTALAHVVGALFVDLEGRVDTWQRVRGLAPVAPLVGEVACPDPEHAPPGLDRLLEAFRLGYRELRDIWTWILPPATIVELGKAAGAPTDRFQIADSLWARIVYDFAFGHAQHVMPRDHLLRSLVPLYSGWMASFVLQVEDRPPAAVEQRLEQAAGAFETEKRYFIARWRWPERFRR